MQHEATGNLNEDMVRDQVDYLNEHLVQRLNDYLNGHLVQRSNDYLNEHIEHHQSDKLNKEMLRDSDDYVCGQMGVGMDVIQDITQGAQFTENITQGAQFTESARENLNCALESSWYVGETSRPLRMRAKEHWDKLNDLSPESFMLVHWMKAHGLQMSPLNSRLRVTGSYTDSLTR